MLHLFVDPAAMQGDELTITGSDVNHMKNVMRLKAGDEISVSNGADDREYRYGVESYGQDQDGSEVAYCRLRFVKEADVELPVRVILFQGLPKSDKMDLIVQKCVELGVSEIVPVAMSRCVMKLEPKKADKKIQRWQTIAESAAAQSRRRIIPRVTMPMTMKEAIAYAKEQADVRLLPYELQEVDESTRNVLAGAKPGSTIAVFIGPEGGFDPKEVEEARAAGISPISLGRRILRTETAGMAILSWFIYLFEIS